MSRVTAITAIASAAFALACEEPLVTCAGTGSPAFIAEVRDAGSGSPAAFGAMLITRFGTLVDTTTPRFQESEALTATTIMSGMGYRPGHWSVSVEKDGYAEWTRADLTLPAAGPCGDGESVLLQVELIPIAAAR